MTFLLINTPKYLNIIFDVPKGASIIAWGPLFSQLFSALCCCILLVWLSYRTCSVWRRSSKWCVGGVRGGAKEFCAVPERGKGSFSTVESQTPSVLLHEQLCLVTCLFSFVINQSLGNSNCIVVRRLKVIRAPQTYLPWFNGTNICTLLATTQQFI